ncbi:MAG: hypothetical protein AAF335_02440 [Bacteroidota bacterium]
MKRLRHLYMTSLLWCVCSASSLQAFSLSQCMGGWMSGIKKTAMSMLLLYAMRTSESQAASTSFINIFEGEMGDSYDEVRSVIIGPNGELYAVGTGHNHNESRAGTPHLHALGTIYAINPINGDVEISKGIGTDRHDTRDGGIVVDGVLITCGEFDTDIGDGRDEAFFSGSNATTLEPLWVETLGNSENDRCRRIIKTSDGGFAILFETENYKDQNSDPADDNDDDEDMAVAKFDSPISRNLQWIRGMGDESFLEDHPTGLVELNGGMMAVGYTDNQYTDNDGEYGNFVKFDNNGVTLCIRRLITFGRTFVMDADAFSDDSVVFVGYRCYDSGGDELCDAIYGLVSPSCTLNYLMKITDSNYNKAYGVVANGDVFAITGLYQIENFFLGVFYKANGTEYFGKQLDLPGVNYGRDVKVTPQGDYFVGGFGNVGTGDDKNIVALLKGDGSADCGTTISFTITQITFLMYFLDNPGLVNQGENQLSIYNISDTVDIIPFSNPSLYTVDYPVLQSPSYQSSQCLQTASPTMIPTVSPTPSTSSPTSITGSPTHNPSATPTHHPTDQPSFSPTKATSHPTQDPTGFPTEHPSKGPSFSPTETTFHPTKDPSATPTHHPTGQPSFSPTLSTANPTKFPSKTPSIPPTKNPSASPTITTANPTNNPSTSPTRYPTGQPSFSPTLSTANPTKFPSKTPSIPPTNNPSASPTITTTNPTNNPSTSPTHHPTGQPSFSPRM